MTTEEYQRLALTRLQTVCTPWAVVIFGSRARGDNSADADLDLLVIMETAPTDPWVLSATIRRAIGPIGIGVDVLVTDRATWDRKRQVTGSLEGMVAREGHVVLPHAA